MSAVPIASAIQALSLLSFACMQASDLAEVLQIEEAAYPYPWTRGNFQDSMDSGYQAWVVRDASDRLLGYFLLMPIADEMHLLNVTVHQDWHRCGIGRLLLDKVVALADEKAMTSILLEVRPSNLRALSIYERYGFGAIGRRKDYYPAAANGREDAIVMRLRR